jgi:hypothetical protein
MLFVEKKRMIVDSFRKEELSSPKFALYISTNKSELFDLFGITKLKFLIITHYTLKNKNNNIMRGSIKSIRNFIVVIALSLFAINTQAQTVTLATFSEAAFLTSVGNETVINIETTTRRGGGTVISAYQEGAAILEVEGKFGLINKEGYEICQPIYDDIHLYNHGYAAVKKNDKWTFVNKQGQQLTALRYDWVGSFENGLVAVLSEGKWGLLNEQGFEVVPTDYEAVKVDQDGKIWVQKNETWKEFGSEKRYNGDIAYK